MSSKDFYKNRFHPQRNLSKANILLYYHIVKTNNIKSIFEFGCGVGRNLIALKSLGYNVSGCDISQKAVDKAIQSNLDVFVGDDATLPKHNKFDLIITNSVLCHMPNGMETLEELKDLCTNIIICEAVDKIGEHWYAHEYKGEVLEQIKSHKVTDATYNIIKVK